MKGFSFMKGGTPSSGKIPIKEELRKAHLADLELSQSLASRFCHDLAAPLSALGIGLEMLDDVHSLESLDEIKNLLRFSCESAITRLEFFRLLLGYHQTHDSPSWYDLNKIIPSYAKDKKATLEWKIPLESIKGGAQAKQLTALIYIALEMSLSTCHIVIESPQLITIEGERLQIPTGLNEVKNDKVAAQELTSKNVMYIYCMQLFLHNNQALCWEQTNSQSIRLSLKEF